jgi:uncharacterized protein
MDRAAVIAILRTNEDELRRRGVRHAALFGSLARGEAVAASDIDLLIDLDRGAIRDVFAYAGLCRFIGELFPGRVDVSDRATLKPPVRRNAEHDAVPAF